MANWIVRLWAIGMTMIFLFCIFREDTKGWKITFSIAALLSMALFVASFTEWFVTP